MDSEAENLRCETTCTAAMENREHMDMEGGFIPPGEEHHHFNNESKRLLLQDLDRSQDKVKTLEELNKRISQTLKSEEMAWKNEKDELLNLLASCENNLNEVTEKAKGLTEKLSRAECAVEHLTKSKEKLVENAAKREIEMQQLVDRLTEAEFALQEKISKETSALKDSLLEKDKMIMNLKVQRAHIDKEHSEMDSVIQELQEFKSIVDDLRNMLDHEQKKFTALEELRKRDIERFTQQEMSWKNEREEIVRNLNSLHDDVSIKEDHVQQLKYKLSFAEDAMKHMTESKSSLINEVSKLKTEMQQTYLQLKAAESTIESLEKSKENDVHFSSELLDVKTREIEALRHEIMQYQGQITAMAADIASLKDVQLMHASCDDLLKKKEEEILAMSLSQENSRYQLKTLQEEYTRNTENLAAELDRNLEFKNAAESRLEEVKAELERTHMALEKAQVARTELKAEMEKVMDTLVGLEEEKLMLMQQNLQSHELREASIKYAELRELHQKSLLQWSEKENSWMMERDNFLSQIEMIEEKLADKECSLQTISSAFHTLKSSYERLEQKLATSDEQNVQSLRQLDEMNALLELRSQELKDLEAKISFTSSALTAVLQEKECILTQTKEKMGVLESEMLLNAKENEKLSFQTESLNENVRMYQQKIEDMEQNMIHINRSLSEKMLEISSITERKDSMETELLATTEELRLAKDKIEMHTKELRECIVASDQKLQRTVELMHKKEEEIKELLISLEDKESTINQLSTTKGALLEENGIFKQSVKALQEKADTLSLELDNEKGNAERLFRVVEEKDIMIASKIEELGNLQKMFESSMASQDSIASYEEKVKELEENVVEATMCLQEKEERLIASEWAVQQLANEVSKAKNSLAQKERDEVLLQNRLSDVENHLKAKENEVMEINGYMQKLIKKNSVKHSEVDKLSQAFERMQEKETQWKVERETLVAEIERIGIALEAKIGELLFAEEQINQKIEKENMMEGAIQSLKSQLTSCCQLLEDEQSKCKLLLHDLEKAQCNESSTAQILKEVERKLDESDKIGTEKVQKLEASLVQAREELLFTSSNLLKLEADLLASLHEVTSEKEKRAALSQVASAKEGALKDLQHGFDLLQEQFKEQKMLTDEKDMELKCHMDKERILTERCSLVEAQLQDMQMHFESMQEQTAMLTSKVHTMATETSAKTEEIEQLKQTEKNMQRVLCERENHINKLIEELENSFRSMHGKEADINLARQLLSNAEIDLIKAREDIHSKNEALSEALVRLSTAEENCRTLEGKMERMQAELEGAIVSLRARLEGELQEKQNMFELSNAEWKSAVDELNSKLEAYYRNESSVEAQVMALIRTMKDMQFLLHEDEGLCALITMLDLEDMDLCHTGSGVEPDDKNMEVAEMVVCDSKQLQPVVYEDKQKFKGTSKIRELQMAVKELQLEQHRRRNREDIILQKTKDALLKLLEKEGQFQELVNEIQSHKKREVESIEWVEKILSSQLELEKEVKMAMTSSHPIGFAELPVSQWQSDISQFHLQIAASRQEISQLCGRWKLIIEAYKQHTLSAVRSISQELEKNSMCQDKHGDTQALSTSFTREFDEEIMLLKLGVVASIQQKDTELADLVMKAENLQRVLQEKKDKENASRGDILKMQLLLQDSLKELGQCQCGNTLPIDMYDELGSCGEEKGSDFFVWSVELKRAFLLAEKLKQQIKFIEEERNTELTTWMNKVESAVDQNNALVEELAVVKLTVESTHIMMSDLQNWKAKAEAAAKEACSLRLELSQNCDAIDNMQLCIKNKEEELLCIQSNLEGVNASKEHVDTKLEFSANEICRLEKVAGNLKDERTFLETKLEECKELGSALGKEVSVLKEKQASLEMELEEWKEAAHQASHDKTALQSDLTEAQKTIELLVSDKDSLQSELKAALGQLANDMTTLTSDLSAARLTVEQLESDKTILLAQLTTAQHAMTQVENEKAVLQSEKNTAQLAMNLLENDKDTLVSELTAARHGVEQLKVEKHLLQLELHDMGVKIKLSTEENSALRSKLEGTTEKQTSCEIELEKWKEAASQASHDIMTLQSDLTAARRGMEQVESDKSTLLSELNASQHSMRGLEDDKINLLSQLNVARLSMGQLEDDRINLISELSAARNAMEQLENDKHQLQHELHDMDVKIKSSIEENSALRSKVEVTTDLQKKLEAADRERLHLQNLCQKLEADLIFVQAESGKRERSALSMIQASSSENRVRVESRLLALYEALTNDSNDSDQATSSLLGRKDVSLGSTPVNGATKDTEQQSCSQDDYVHLCDSLIRRHARLEKQLDNLAKSVSRQCQHAGDLSPAIGQGLTASAFREEQMVDRAEGQDNRKKVKRGGMNSESETYERVPLQPISSQVGVIGRTPSPCAKRRRSNSSSSKTLKDQNDSPSTSVIVSSQDLASCVQKTLYFPED